MSELILYQTEDGKAEVRLRAGDGSVWLTQWEIAELFATTKQNVSLHAANVLREGELVEHSVVKDSLTTAADGKNYRTKLYRLEMIFAIGYRVRSPRGIQFRQWATAPNTAGIIRKCCALMKAWLWSTSRSTACGWCRKGSDAPRICNVVREA